MNNFETALVHELCPLCGTETNHQIVLNQKLTPKAAQEVRNMHGKAIGFSDPCPECQSKIDEGYVALIGIDPEKSSPSEGMVKFENIYRTGDFGWIRREAAKDMFGWDRPEDFILLEKEVFLKLASMGK